MGYRFLRFPEGRTKALTLSYDDGCKFDPQLIDIANKYGIKVTLNVNSGMFGKDDWHLSAKQLKELAASGNHELAVHGAHHIALGKATTAMGIRDILHCREAMEKEFGGIIRGMAYADSGITSYHAGVTYEEIRTYLKDLGIAYSRSLAGDNDKFEIPADFYQWIPTAHHENPKMMEYLDKFLNEPLADSIAARTPRLFYLWGHSFEFDRNDNWNLFEEFCKTASGHDDVWYATNIEICDYVNAFRSLQCSMDDRRIYNPTCTTIWFEVDGKGYSIAPGELLEIDC